MISRAERTLFSDWAWTVDRWLLASLALLIVAGLVFAMAGSPPVAERLHLPTFHFVNRQVLYLLPALVLMIATSFLSPRHVRRLALVIFIVSLALVFATIFYGQEVKGAKRWIFGVQPSEFLKPAFVVLVAWAFSEGARRKDVPGNLIALLL
ncbi:MAG: FtsW/RodA/SpoVE family cell cycle protein, partial [Methylocystis sp.]